MKRLDRRMKAIKHMRSFGSMRHASKEKCNVPAYLRLVFCAQTSPHAWGNLRFLVEARYLEARAEDSADA